MQETAELLLVNVSNATLKFSLIHPAAFCRAAIINGRDMLKENRYTKRIMSYDARGKKECDKTNKKMDWPKENLMWMENIIMPEP